MLVIDGADYTDALKEMGSLVVSWVDGKIEVTIRAKQGDVQ